MSKVTMGSFFSLLYTTYSIKSMSKKLKNQSLKDLPALDKTLIRFEKLTTNFVQNPIIEEMVKKNPGDETKSLLVTMAKHMSSFNQAQFEKAFDSTQKAYNESKKEDLKLSYLVVLLDTMNTIKSNIVTNTDREMYQKNYAHFEKEYSELIEKAADAKAINSIKLNKLKDGQEVKIDIEYDGSYMSLAYLSYLNNDLKKAYEYMDKLINKLGVEKVRKHESGQESNAWFYRHCNNDYQFLVTSACDKYEALKNKQTQIMEQNLILSQLQHFANSPKLMTQNQELVLGIKEKLTSLLMKDNQNTEVAFEIKDTCIKVLPNLMQVFTQTQNKEAKNSDGKNAHDFLTEALSSVSSYLDNISVQHEDTQLVDMEAYSSFVQKKFKQSM
jgi:hypothetical protein